MKNFIFAMCGFLMMSLVSLGVQASSISEPIPSKSELSAVDVGLPDIQYVTFEAAPLNCFVLTDSQPVMLITNSSVVQSVMTMNVATQGSRFRFLSVRSGTSINRSIVRIIVTLYIVD